MAIPGLRAELPVRAKVRVGKKNSSGYPTSLDHFVCDHPAWMLGEPKEVRIIFPYATVEECFPSGLERWVPKRDKSGSILSCYTKGDGTAHGLGGRIQNGLTVLDVTQPRLDFECRAQGCNLYGKEKGKGCVPKMRLYFNLPDEMQDGVWCFETGSVHTYQQISAVLTAVEKRFGTLLGSEFTLRAKRISGANTYTLVEIDHVKPPAVPAAGDVEGSQTALPGAGSPSTPSQSEYTPREKVIALLDELGQDPTAPDISSWVRTVGYERAAALLTERLAQRG